VTTQTTDDTTTQTTNDTTTQTTNDTTTQTTNEQSAIDAATQNAIDAANAALARETARAAFPEILAGFASIDSALNNAVLSVTDSPDVVALIGARDLLANGPHAEALAGTILDMNKRIEDARVANGMSMRQTLRELFADDVSKLAAKLAVKLTQTTDATQTTSKPASKKSADDTIETLDGVTYRKVNVSRKSFDTSTAKSCGQCAFAKNAELASVGGAKIPNLRQNNTRGVEKMTSADVETHRPCIAAANAAMLDSYDHIVVVIDFERVG